jgi:hypothetical protein
VGPSLYTPQIQLDPWILSQMFFPKFAFRLNANFGKVKVRHPLPNRQRSMPGSTNGIEDLGTFRDSRLGFWM